MKRKRSKCNDQRISEINAKIADLKKQLSEVKGTVTEVYSRIVGYYRPLSLWNAGQRAAYGFRVMFDIENKGNQNAPKNTPKPKVNPPGQNPKGKKYV